MTNKATEAKPDENSYIESKIEEGTIQVYGAREHNLANFDVTLPRNNLIVFTGLSGSGKSSLAFDTLYAEGQRRYMETFAAYARQFIGHLTRPDVDKIDGLSPVISIEQKTVSKNPRSTVGTITEIYDFLRLLYARTAEAYSYETGKKMVRFTDDQILDTIINNFSGKRISILAPVVKGRKGHYREVFEQNFKLGFTKMRIDGDIQEIEPGMKLSRYKIHDIELLVDRVKVKESDTTRLRNSVQTALKQGNGTLMLLDHDDNEKARHFSRNLMCPDTGISYDEPQPNTFSFNSPYGYCPECKGTGRQYEFDEDDILPDKSKSIAKGAIEPMGSELGFYYESLIKALGNKYNFKLNTPINKFSREAIDCLLYGSNERLQVDSFLGKDHFTFEGIVNIYRRILSSATYKSTLKKALEEMVRKADCPDCNGYRLNRMARHFMIDGKHIGEVANLQIDRFYEWINNLNQNLEGNRKVISNEILKEIRQRTGFLLNVGLDYLSINRPAYSLSGGEAQRIRLATQVGSQLINVLYILDEPSIGLHQRDNHRLTNALKELRDIGNTVIVVEHDRDMMLQSDHILDHGPGAGKHGGEIVAEGPPSHIINSQTQTAQYLRGESEIELPAQRRYGHKNKYLQLQGAEGNNLKSANAKFPLGKLICVTGVSGSGKSTLINETVYPILKREFYRSKQKPLSYKKITGVKHLDKVIEINQAPIGRTPRSNPATYTGVFSHIRKLFSELPEAKIRGYQPGQFSFNVKGGRCEECKGGGVKTIEMNFLPDVYVECPECLGKRYNRETLEVRYKGKSISDVLDMTVEEAVTFFENIPYIKRKLQTINDVGLGYIHLGQPSTTLSGGEAQRVKLATELSKVDTGKTFYILDEPTTGLHFEDIRILMDVLGKLVDKGNTVLIIEHNLDVIKLADYIIDVGPEGGDEGGEVVVEGSPEQIIKKNKGHTAQFLKREMEETVGERSLEAAEELGMKV